MNSQWTIWVQHQTEEINEHRDARKVEVKKAEKIIKTSTATMQAIFQLVTKLLAFTVTGVATSQPMVTIIIEAPHQEERVISLVQKV